MWIISTDIIDTAVVPLRLDAERTGLFLSFSSELLAGRGVVGQALVVLCV